MLERIRTLFAGNHILAVPRAAVLTGLLVVLLASAAKVTATFDLDEKLIGRRLDTWAMGHPDPLHCTSPADAEIDRAKNAYPPVGREPPKDLILMQFHGQKVTGLPGTLCFRSEAELFEHFGKDPERRFCVRTETNPTGLDEVTRIPLTEPLPPDGARCFRTFGDVAAHFGFEP